MKIATDLLFKSCGIELADRLSIDHINLSLKNIEEIEWRDPNTNKLNKVLNIDNDQFAQALMGVALKVKTRKH